MKQALQIISIQHGLAMAIGNELDLDEMLRSFINASIASLGLSGAHFFLFCNETKDLVHLSEESLDATLSHYMSFPFTSKNKARGESHVLQQFAHDHIKQSSFISVNFYDEKVYQIFSIPNHGVAIFESGIEIEPPIQIALEPIFRKLALSCYGCLAHQSLIKEIEARRSAEEVVAHQAVYDELTQLYNRRMLTENLKKSIAYCKEKNKFGALIFIDLNQFKSINDVVGLDIGDAILIEVASRLKSITRGKDTVARFGGDEFIILLPDLGDDEHAANMVVNLTATRIVTVVEEPFTIGEFIYSVSCSMGFEIFSNANSSSCDVIKHADLAMYEAKALRQRTALRYQPSMSEKLNLHSLYVSEIKNALKNNEFILYYQPQYNFNRQIIGAEALLRWNNPKRINESPDIYIPIAEDSELILAIGDWVLYESCRQLKVLQENGLPDSFKKLSINVSAKQLGQKNFFENICHAIKLSGVGAGQMAIEITENVLISRIHDAMVLISQLSDIGVDCAIDDFGTGYSSLTYLRRLPSSLIKIDRSFVRDIHKDADNRSIAKMIIALGQNLEMNILAEGVESVEELQCLKDLGCFQYQGFYFSRPLPFDQFLTLIKTPYLEAC